MCGTTQVIPNHYLGTEIKCNTCRKNFVAKVCEEHTYRNTPQSNKVSVTRETKAEGGIPILVALLTPFFAAVLIYFWIGSMSLIEAPTSKLMFIAVMTVFGTAITIGIDADRLGMGRTKKGFGPVGISLMVVLLWILFYPYYFVYRVRHGAKNYAIYALIVTILFIVASYSIGSAINEQQDKVKHILDSI